MAGDHGLNILSDTTTREILPKLVKDGRLIEMSDPDNKSAKRYYPPDKTDIDTMNLVGSALCYSESCKVLYDHRDPEGVSHLLEQSIDVRYQVYLTRIRTALVAVQQIALAAAFKGPDSPMYAKERRRVQDALTAVVQTMKADPEYNKIRPLIQGKLFGVGPDTSEMIWARLFV